MLDNAKAYYRKKKVEAKPGSYCIIVDLRSKEDRSTKFEPLSQKILRQRRIEMAIANTEYVYTGPCLKSDNNKITSTKLRTIIWENLV